MCCLSVVLIACAILGAAFIAALSFGLVGVACISMLGLAIPALHKAYEMIWRNWNERY